METIETLKSASGSAKYYAGYYEQGKYSQWFGKGSERLGLKGEVKQADFEAVLKGELPNGQVLGRYGKDGKWEHRPGYDKTFSAPKSVSLLALIGGDDRLINAHMDAVAKVVDYIEREYCYARKKEDGVEKPVQTKDLIAALFTEFSNKNNEPQLHTHSVLMNATFDGEKYRALWSDIFSDKGKVKYLGKVYRNQLAENVKELGYDLVKVGREGFFEIKGINRKLIEYFSTRRQEIVKWQKDTGFSGTKAAQIANRETKKGKTKNEYTLEELKPRWYEALNKCVYGNLKELKSVIRDSMELGKDHVVKTAQERAEHAVRDAIDDISIYRERFTEKELFEKARGFGLTVDNGLIRHVIEQAYDEGDLVKNSTDEVMLRDTYQMICGLENNIAHGRDIKLMGNFAAKLCCLGSANKEQLKELLTSNKQFVGLDVAKQDLYDLTREFVTSSKFVGYKVTAITPKFLDKELHQQKQVDLGCAVYSVEGFLKYWNENPKSSGQVFILDEAEKYKYAELNKIIVLANSMDAKVLFRIKQKPYTATQTLVEQGLHMVGTATSYDLNQALSDIKDKVQVEQDRNKQQEIIKNLFQDNIVPKVIVMTSADKALVNKLARDVRIENGQLGSTVSNINSLEKISLSGIRKSKIAEYQEGYVLRMDGSYYKVYSISHKENTLHLISSNGDSKDFNLEKNSIRKLEVFRSMSLEVRVGDCLAWSKTVSIDGQRRIAGQRVFVSEINNNSITVINKKSGEQFVIDSNNYVEQHIDYDNARMAHLSFKGVDKYQLALVNRDLESNQLVDLSERLGNKGVLLVDSYERIQEKSLDKFTPVELEKYKLTTEQAKARDILYSVMSRSNEREAIQTKRQLLEKCINQGVDIPLARFQEAVNGFIDKGEIVISDIGRETAVATKYTIDHEKLCLDLAKDSKNSFEPIMPINHPKLQEILNDEQLTNGQKNAIKEILTTKDGVLLVQGLAGVGKTFMMKKVLEACRDMDVHVVGLGVTASSRIQLDKELRSVTGDGFETCTVARFNDLVNKGMLSQDSKTLIIPDEASFIDVVSANKIMMAGKNAKALIAFTGDCKQNPPVGLSYPYELMLAEKVTSVAMTETVRFKTEQSINRVAASYANDIDKIIDNSIVEVVKPMQDEHGNEKDVSIQKVASDYAQLAKTSQKDVAVVTLRNVDKDIINDEIRKQLNDIGLLQGDMLKTTALVNRKELFDVDKEYIQTYNAGNVIKFSGGFKGDIAKNEYCKVVEVNNGIVTLNALKDNRTIYWSPNLHKDVKNRVEVHSPVERELQQGDKLIWKSNDDKRGIFNGEGFTVLKVDNINKTFTAKLSNGKTITVNATDSINKHWDYSYCRTSFIIQGDTIENTIAYIKAWGGGYHNIANLLVNASRGDNFKIIIDDIGKFIEALNTERKELAQHTAQIFDKNWHEKRAFIDSLVAKVTSVHWDKRTQAQSSLSGEYNLQTRTNKIEEYLDANKQAGVAYSKYKRMSEPFPVANRNKYTLPNNMLKVADGLLKEKEPQDIATELRVSEDFVLQQRNNLRKTLDTGKNNDKLITELSKIEKKDFKVDKSRYEVLETCSNKEKVELAQLKTSSINKLELRNRLGFEIIQNKEDFKSLLSEHNIDIDKLSAHATKHQEKIKTTQSLNKSNKPKLSKQPNNYVDKDIIIDRLHTDISGFARNLLGEPDKVTNSTMFWGKKGSMQVHTSGSKTGYWMDWEQGEGGRNLLSLYLNRTGQGFKEGIERLSKDLNLTNISPLTSEQRKARDKEHALKQKQQELEENKKQSFRVKLSRDLYNRSKPIKGTIGQKYFRKERYIKHELPDSFKYNQRVYHSELKKKIPAIVAPIQDQNGDIKGVVRTYLENDGSKLNRNIRDNKGKIVKATTKGELGKKRNNFVLVNKGINNEKVYLAEGIETAASLVGSCKDNTVLAVLAVHNFSSVKLFKETKEVVICADRDGHNSQSFKALQKAVANFESKGIKVSIVMPECNEPNRKMDFNDLLKEKGQDAVSRSISKPVDIKKEFEISKQLAKLETDKKKEHSNWRIKEAGKLYNDSKPIEGTIGEKYFNDLQSPIPKHFKFNENVVHPELKTSSPAIIAPITNKDNQLQGVMKIFLDREGNVIDKEAKPSNDLGKKTGNFIAITENKDNPRIYLANSLEEGLSIAPNCIGSTVVCALSLKNFQEIPMDNAKEIIICGSFDDVTKNSYIFQAVEHFKEKGVDVSIRVPEISGNQSLSFQNLLQEHGRDAISESLNKPMDINKSHDNIVAISSKGKAIEHNTVIAQKRPESAKQEHVVQQQQRNVEIDRQMMR